MRVAFLSIHGHVDPIPNLGLTDTGGQVVYVLELAKQLGKLGVHVDIYTRLFENKKQKEKVSQNVEIIRIPCGPNKFIRKEDLFPYLDEYIQNFLDYVNQESLKYDVIHSHYWDAGYIAMKLKEKIGALWAHTSHSLGLLKKILLGEKSVVTDYKFDTRIKTEKQILSKADILISASPIEQKYVKELYRIERKYELVPPGVDTEFFNPKNIRDIELPKNYVFSTGRIEWTKGFDLLVKAFAIVAKKHKSEYLILGGGSEKPTKLEMEVREEITRLAKEAGISDRIIQTGRIPNDLLPTYYAKADVVVLPSRYDLFGMVAIEALACGRPVIVSKYAGVSKLIKDSFGLIADPKNPKDLAEKINYLLKNRELALKMGQEGRKYILKNFTWKKLAEKLLDIYKRNLFKST